MNLGPGGKKPCMQNTVFGTDNIVQEIQILIRGYQLEISC